jgi:broad specificity phosphatase PhoE
MGDVILLRHGETDLEAPGKPERIAGWQGVRLNAQGREQSKQAAQKLKGEEIAKLYSSDLPRADDTARIFSTEHPGHPEVNSTQHLRPWNVGPRFENKTEAETKKTLTHYREDIPGIQVPTGESFNKHLKRLYDEFLEADLKQAAERDGVTIYVTHSRNFPELLALVAKGNPHQPDGTSPEPGQAARFTPGEKGQWIPK